MKIAIVNGPNLNLLGIREPEIYGSVTFTTYLDTLRKRFAEQDIQYFQSNIEGELVDYLQACMQNGTEAIVLNAGAYTHTSLAIADCLAAISVPCIEVHISNVMAREEYRKTSFLAAKCIGSISGLGLMGYELAVHYFIQTLQNAN